MHGSSISSQQEQSSQTGTCQQHILTCIPAAYTSTPAQQNNIALQLLSWVQTENAAKYSLKAPADMSCRLCQHWKSLVQANAVISDRAGQNMCTWTWLLKAMCRHKWVQHLKLSAHCCLLCIYTTLYSILPACADSVLVFKLACTALADSISVCCSVCTELGIDRQLSAPGLGIAGSAVRFHTATLLGQQFATSI